MASESTPKIHDYVAAELVECTPSTDAEVALQASQAPEGASPTLRAAAATVEQTGCDPPPVAASHYPAACPPAPLTPHSRISMPEVYPWPPA